MSDQVHVTLDAGVLELALARPEKKNALTSAMYVRLVEALDGAATDPAVRAVLLHGEGSTFTAGNDIGDFLAAATAGGDFRELPVMRFLAHLAAAEKPLVAAVQGAAIGIGTTLLLHCDLVFVDEEAKLKAPFVDLALVPEAASSLLMPARLGHPRAFALFALGETLSGREAAALGLANAALPAAEVLPRARAAAQALALRPKVALALTKRLMRDAAAIQQVIEREAVAFAQQLTSAEAREALTAFLERRRPDFTKL